MRGESRSVKTCPKCRQSKPLAAFSARTRPEGRRPRSRCKACESIDSAARVVPGKNRAWEQANPDAFAAQKLRQRMRKAGVRPEDFEAVAKALATQTACPICGGPPKGRWKVWHLDHDHTTGRFRGLLCDGCNLGLGKFHDRSAVLRRAADYLEAAKH